MASHSLVCKQCGASTQMPEGKDFGFCVHCGTKTVLKADIVQKTIIKNVYGKDRTEAQDYIESGNNLIELGEYAKAKNAFDKAIEINSADWTAWFGFVRLYTKNFTDYKDTIHEQYLGKARKLASGDNLKQLELLYEGYTTEKTRRAEIQAETTKQQKEDTKKLLKIFLIIFGAMILVITSIVIAVKDSDAKEKTFLKQNTFEVCAYNYGGESQGYLLRSVVYGRKYKIEVSPLCKDYFVGWYTEPNGMGTKLTGSDGVGKWHVRSNTNIYAHFSVIVCSIVRFDYQSATGNTFYTSNTVFYNNDYTFPVPTKTGYIFQGWYEQADGFGTQYTNNLGNSLSKWLLQEDITVFAYWI